MVLAEVVPVRIIGGDAENETFQLGEVFDGEFEDDVEDDGRPAENAFQAVK